MSYVHSVLIWKEEELDKLSKPTSATTYIENWNLCLQSDIIRLLIVRSHLEQTVDSLPSVDGKWLSQQQSRLIPMRS